jgi:quercetin 2,3-dioxygenase
MERRSFLSKLGLGLSALVTMPVGGVAQINKLIDKEEDMNKDKKVIKKIKPLGFQWETADPFLFCVHHEDKFPKGNDDMGPAVSLKGREIGNDFIIKDGFRMYHGKKVPGFPGHPHRGFETITIVREGLVDHADSMGAAGRYGNGDVQWMTAGKGVQHSEMFPLLSKEKENPMELFQIWLNLPAKNKMVDPHFTMFWKDKVPNFVHKDSNGNETKVEVIAGKLADKKAPAPPPNSWASDLKNEVAVWNIRMKANAVWTLPKAVEIVNRTLYFYIGEQINMAGENISKYHAIEVDPNEEIVIKNGNHLSCILMLQGKPIDEPVMQYGPFVMNTKQEIQQAFDDYNKTKFGGWPWPRYDMVHDKTKGRFAKHSDGKEEVK